MEKKENQRVALTKRLLKESLMELMETKNIQKISVSELCHNAGINRTTFYHHYGSQFDLLRELEQDMLAEMDAIWYAREADAEWTLRQRIETLCIYFKAHEHEAKLLLRNSDTNSEFAELLFRSAHTKRTSQRLFSKPMDDDAQKLTTTFLTNGIYSLFRQWLLEDIPKSPQEMADLICGINISALID